MLAKEKRRKNLQLNLRNVSANKMWTESNPSLPSQSQADIDNKNRMEAIRANELHTEKQRINSNETLNSENINSTEGHF